MNFNDISDFELNKLLMYVKSVYGIDLSTKNKDFILVRLQRVFLQFGFERFEDFYNYIMLDKSGELARSFLDHITTNYTFFLREPEHFIFLREVVLPYLESVCRYKKDIRIWSAGCSSGEEAYSIAMVISDYFANKGFLWDKKLLATDISSKSVKKAIEGIYTADQLEALPNEWKEKFFKKLDNDKYSVIDSLKNEITFRVYNLNNETYPFKNRFHAIFCRNVMIYFDSETRKKQLDKFYEWMVPGGYLFIGHSEYINQKDSNFVYILPSVYRKM